MGRLHGAEDAGTDAGARVPEQVKVIGVDNVDESAYLVPSLSTVAPDHDAMAERAVAFLCRRMAGRNEQTDPAPGGPEEYAAPYALVVRESTGPGRPRASRG